MSGPLPTAQLGSGTRVSMFAPHSKVDTLARVTSRMVREDYASRQAGKGPIL